MKQKRSEFRVRGSYPFPLDMLRYDSCFPADERDSNLLRTACTDYGVMTVIEITLATHRPDVSPSNDRWKSYGWEVTQEELCK